MPKKGRQATRTTPGFTGPFKGQPQPGTLFDVRTVPKTGEIGPRGYSLNRSRQFQKLISEPPETGGGGARMGAPVGMKVKLRPWRESEDEPFVQGTSEEYGTTPAVRPEQHPFGPAHLGEIHNRPVSMGEWSRKEAQHPGYFEPSQERRKAMGRARSKMIDTLARSTVDPEHLHGLQQFEIEPQHPERAGSYHPEGGFGSHIKLHVTGSSAEERIREGETFHPDWVKQTKQRGPVDPEAEMTAIHEIGHHVSHQAGTSHSGYRGPTQQGREEAFADAYMLTHFRHDPRSERWAGRTDPREHTYLARGLEHAHFGQTVGGTAYREKLGPSGVKPPRTSLGPTIKESGEEEALARPMLDDPRVRLGHEATFTEVPKGWSGRAGIYQKAAQKTNIARSRVLGERGAQGAEIKRRWSVNRNQNLGQQWDER